MALTRPKYSQIPDTDFKQSVRVATTADIGNVMLSQMPNTVDGISLNFYDRVLVRAQANAAQNGIYQVIAVGTGSNGIWERTKDANAGSAEGKVTPAIITLVEEGTINSGRTFRLTTTGNIDLGTTNLSFGVSTAEPAGSIGQLQFANIGNQIGGVNISSYDYTTGNLTFASGNIRTAALFQNGKRVPQITSSATPPTNPADGDQWYQVGTDILYEWINDGATSYWVDVTGATIANVNPITGQTVGTLVVNSGQESFSTNTGALQVVGGVGISGNLNVGGSVSFGGGQLGSDMVITSGTTATSETTGAIRVASPGGLGIGGNIWAGGIVVANSRIPSTSTTTGAVILPGTGGIGIGGNIWAGGDITALGNITGGGIRQTISSNAPVNPVVGDQWYQLGTDVLYQYVSDGTNKYWVDVTGATVANITAYNQQSLNDIAIVSGTPSTSATSGALQVAGGVGVVGNIYLQGNLDVSGGNIIANQNVTSTNTVTGSMVVRGQGGIGVGGNVNIGGNLSVLQTATFAQNVQIAANLTSGGTYFTAGGLTVTNGNIVANGSFANIGGLTITNGGFGDLASLGVLGAVSIGGLANIGGAANIIGSATIGGDLSVTGNVSGGGLRKYAQINAPTNPVVGDVWYKTDTDVYYTYVNDGTNKYWIDYVGPTVSNASVQAQQQLTDLQVVSGTQSTSPTTGALTISGGAGITGNVYIAGNADIGSNVLVNNLTANLNVQASTLAILNNATVGGTLTVGGSFGVGGTLDVTGAVSTGNLTTGNITGYGFTTNNGNITAIGQYFSAGGLSVTAGNISAYGFTVSNGNIASTGTLAVLGGLVIENGGISSLANLNVVGSGTIGGDLAVTGNVTGGGLRKTASVNAPVNPVVGDVWYKTDTDVYYTYVNDGTSKYWIDYVGATVSNAAVSNSINSDFRVASGTESYDSDTGALTVVGGAGLTGNLWVGGLFNANGNIVANSGTASSNATTGALVVRGGAGVTGNINIGTSLAVGTSLLVGTTANVVGNFNTLGNISAQGRVDITGNLDVVGRVTGGGIRKTTSINAPANPVVGDIWYKTDTDTVYQYIHDGTSNYWIDISGATIANVNPQTSQTLNDIVIVSGTSSTSQSTGALQILGGIGATGNLYLGGGTDIGGNLVANNILANNNLQTSTLQVLNDIDGNGNINIAGLATIGGNLSATGQYFAAGGLSVTAGNVLATGQRAELGGLVIENGAFGNLSSLGVIGLGTFAANVNVAGNANITGDIIATGNIVAGGVRKYAQISAPANPVVGDQWYKTDTDALYQYINDGTNKYWIDVAGATVSNASITSEQIAYDIVVTTDTQSTSATTGAIRVQGGIGVIGNIFTTGLANFGSNLVAGNILANNNLQASSLQILNDANIAGTATVAGNIIGTGNYFSAAGLSATAGNIAAFGFTVTNGNLTANGATATIGGLTITNGSFENIASLTVLGTANIGGDVVITGNVTGGGIRKTSSIGAPANPAVGDQWYKTDTDTLYQYINDGTNKYWIDVAGATVSNASITSEQIAYDIVVTTDTQSTNATTGAIRVQGGIGLIGNIFTTGLANFGSNLTAQNILANNNLQTATLQVLNDIDGNGNLDIAGSASITGNLTSAGNYFSAGGLSVTAGNITAFGFSTNGVSATIGGLTITNGSFGNVASLSVLGTANIGGDLTVTGNITGGGVRKTASISAPANPVVGDLWYKTDTDVLYQYVNDGTNTYWIDYTSATVSNASPTSPQSLQDLQIVSGTPSTTTTTGALVVTGGAGISGNINAGNVSATNISAGIFTYANGVNILTGNEGTYSNANVTDYLTTATISTSGNISSTGSYFAGGGLSVTAGNVLATSANIGGLIISSGGIGQLASIDVTGSGNIGGDFAVTGNITGGGLRKYAQTSAPANPVVGDVWYKTDTDVFYQYVNDGTSKYWIDYTSATVSNVATTAGTNVDFQITSGTPSVDNLTGALTVVGGLGVSGNINANNINTTTFVATNIQGSNFYFANGTSVASAITGTYSNANVIGLLAASISTGDIVSSGNITATGNITGGGIRKTTSINAPVNPVVGDLWYKTDTDVLYQYINDGTSNIWVDYVGATVSNAAVDNSTNVDFTITSGTPSTDTETGALRVAGGFGITGNIYASGIISASGNLVANATTASSDTNTGALVVRGGAGIAGATYIGGLLSVGQTVAATGNISGANLTTGQGNFAGNIYAANASFTGKIDIGGDILATGNIVAMGNITGGGIRKYAQSTAPVGAVPGDVWYKTDTDVYYTYVNDGTNSYWIDYIGATVSNAAVDNSTNNDFTVASGTASTSTGTGALRVVGGVGITGNVNAGNVAAGTISGTLFTYANGVSILAGNEGTYSNANVLAYLAANGITATSLGITTSGNITAGGAYFSGGGVTALSGALAATTLNLTGNITSSGTRAVVGGLTIENGSFGNLASLGVIGTATVGGDLAVTGNITGGGLRKYAQPTAPANPVVGDVWYKTDTDIYYQYITDGGSNFWVDFVSSAVANVTQSAQTVSDLEIVSGTTSTSAITGALKVSGGVGVSGNIHATGNIVAGNVTTTGTATVNSLVSNGAVQGASLTVAGNIQSNGFSVLDGAISAASDITTVGNLLAVGLASIGGNLTSGGSYFSAGGMTSLDGNIGGWQFSITNGNITAYGQRAELGGLVIENGAFGNIASLGVIGSATIGGNLTITGNVTGGGIRKTSSLTAPPSPVVGDLWYKTDTDVLYQYINDGSNTFWVDYVGATVSNSSVDNSTNSDFTIASGTAATSYSTGALRVVGGAGISGNIFAGNNVSVGENIVAGGDISAQSAIFAANLTSSNISTGIISANSIGAGGFTAIANSLSIPGVFGVTATGNLTAAGQYFAAGGLSATAGNISATGFSVTNGNLIATGTTATIGGLVINNGGFGSLASLDVTGNTTVGGNVSVTGNITGGGLRKFAQSSAPPNPVVGDIWYKTDTDVVYEYINDGTSNFWVDLTSASVANVTASYDNIGDLNVVGNITVTGGFFRFANGTPYITTTLANTNNIVANISNGFNVGLDLTNTGVTAGNYGSSTSIPTIVVDSKGRISSITTNAVSTTFGLQGNVGTGSVTGGNTIVVVGVPNQIETTVSGSTITIGLTPNITFTDFTVGGTLNVSGNIVYGENGLRTTTSSTPPLNPTPGDMWYQSGTDVLYRYINDGNSQYWVDYFSTPLRAILPSNDIAGGDGQVQYYDSAAFGANTAFVYDKSLSTLRVPRFRITQTQSPVSPTSTGQVGEITWDAGWLYVCIAPNTWRRAGLFAW